MLLDPGTNPDRLVGLLPRRPRSSIQSCETLPDIGDVTKLRAGLFMYAIFIAFIFAVQWIVVSHEPLAQVDGTQAAASNTIFPQTPPPNSGP
jgi:hypothetical protein